LAVCRLSLNADDKKVMTKCFDRVSFLPGSPLSKPEDKKMKTRRFTVILFLTALAFASPMLNAADGTYSAKLITPAAGQVVYPGQKVRVQWMTHLPNINLGAC